MVQHSNTNDFRDNMYNPGPFQEIKESDTVGQLIPIVPFEEDSDYDSDDYDEIEIVESEGEYFEGNYWDLWTEEDWETGEGPVFWADPSSLLFCWICNAYADHHTDDCAGKGMVI